MIETVAAGTHQTYRANENDTVLSEVSVVFCVLMPHALLVAGIDQGGSVVMARHTASPVAGPEWDPAFFEHEFINDPLFGVPQQVHGVFLGSTEELLIPSDLFEPAAAKSWMTSLQAIAPDDVVCHQAVKEIDAEQCFAVPTRIDKLLHRYFGHTPIRHVSSYQFHKPSPETSWLIQMFISQDQVFASLHATGKLLWHQRFAYNNVEEVAWQVARLSRELQIPKDELHLQCTMLSPDLYELGPELERFFPRIRWNSGLAGGPESWTPVLYFLQQLYACAL